MKVISTDNFDRDYIPDALVKRNLTEEEAEKLAQDLNKQYGGDDAPYYYLVVPDDYKLKTFDP